MMNLFHSKTQYLSKLWLLLLFITTTCFATENNSTIEQTTYKIGVLAYKGKASAMKRWFSHQTYLNEKLAPLEFEIVPLGYANDEITNEVIKHNVDFLITNPGNYIELELAGYISRLATRRMKGPSGALDKFGGVAITLPHRTDINKYSDLIGKDVSIPSMSSLGGWQVHLGEALTQGVDLRLETNITELKNHGKVIEAVIAGDAEVGLVRADLIEQLVSEGILRFNQIKVINKQTVSGYPYLLSTRLYPEWPFAIVTGTSTDIATKIVAALLDIHETDPVAIDANIYGWTVPGHYSSVRTLFRTAGLGPYKHKPLTLTVAINKYKYQLLIILTFCVMLLIITIRTKISKDILALEIDERKRAENALSKNKQRVEQAREIAELGIWEIDILSKVLTISDKIYEVFELERGSDISSYKELLAVVHPDDRDDVLNTYRQSVIEKKSFNIEHRLLMTDGKVKYVNQRCDSDFDIEGNTLYSIGTILDITERVETKLKLESQVQELNDVRKASLNIMRDVEDARNEAEVASNVKSRFLANMSHEIRTPLNAVTGMSYLLKQSKLNKEQFSFVDKIELSMNHVLNIINDLLDISKIEAGKLYLEATSFDLNDVCEKLNSIVNIEAKRKNLKLSKNISAEIPNQLIGDPFRLGQVLINLVSNAIKFSEKGEVKIVVNLLGKDKDSVELGFNVIDTGIGMNAKQQSSIFQAFNQADSSTTRRFGGTGLGLSISQYIVNEMGGQISVQSEEGKGSDFSFSIKLGLASQKKLDIDSSTNSSESSVQVIGKSILIVEDQATNRMIAELILQRNGYEVESVENGQLAVELIEKDRSSFDLILMDIQMPIMDGIEATKLIRKKFTSEELPIIAMTAHAMAEEKQKCEEAGMNAHVSKPVDVEVLLSELNRCLS